MPGSSMARTAGRHTVARRLNVEQALKQGKEAGEASYVPQTIPAGEPSCRAPGGTRLGARLCPAAELMRAAWRHTFGRTTLPSCRADASCLEAHFWAHDSAQLQS